MSPSYAGAYQHKINRRQLFQLIKRQQEVGRRLNSIDDEDADDEDSSGYIIESTYLSDEYNRLGREIDVLHTNLIKSM